ncbi:MAG: putative Ig domain-containing protein [Fidelibacterota bacterium]
MWPDKKIIIILSAFVIFFTQYCYGEKISKEIIPFAEKKFALTKISALDQTDEKLFGIGYYFNSKGEQIPGSSFLALCQLNQNTEYSIIWKYELPEDIRGDFQDYALRDIDGDSIQEIIAVADINNTIPNFSSIYVFSQEKGDISLDPQYSFPQEIIPRRIKSLMHYRDNQFFLLYENQQYKVAIITIDDKDIQVTPHWEQKNPEKYFRSKLLQVRGDFGNNLLVRADSDLLFITYLDNDNPEEATYTLFEPNGDVWDISNIIAGDFNGDGQDEIVAGLINGGINMIKQFSDSLTTFKLLSSSASIDQLYTIDIDKDKRDNLILINADGKYLKNYSYNPKSDNYWSSSLLATTDMLGIKFLNYCAIPEADTYCFGYIYPEFSHHGIFRLKITPDSGSEEEAYSSIHPDQEPAEPINYFSQIDSLLNRFTAVDGVSEKVVTPHTSRAIVSGAINRQVKKADFVIEPNRTFTNKVDLYSVSSENLNYTIEAPEGFRFNLNNRTFTWTPDFSQLGPHTVKARFYWDDVEIKKEFTIFVNDPITITNKLPEKSIIQFGEILTYQLRIKDRNPTSFVKYTLHDYPAGATISNYGRITWKPNHNQADWHDFKVSVTDGYSSDELTFSIFVNHPVQLPQQITKTITPGEKLNHKIKNFDQNSGFYLNQYETIPKIQNWQLSGIYETVILSRDAKQQLPNIIDGLNKSEDILTTEKFTLKEVAYEQNKLILFYTYSEDNQPDFSTVLNHFFRYINLPVPNHTSFIEPGFYQYTMKQGPDNAHITKDGIIKWQPGHQDLGTHKIAYTVSDGYYSDESALLVFVNDPPKIVSQPKNYANLNSQYTYQLKVADENAGEEIDYKLIEAPQNTDIDSQGLVTWTINKEHSQPENHFKIMVTDQKDTTYQEFMVRINQKPVVESPEQLITKINRYFEYQIQASDPENGPLEFKPVNIPATANFDYEKGLLFWKPGKEDLGTHQITIKVTDREGNATRNSFDLIVTKSTIDLKTISIIGAGAVILASVLLLAI